MTTLTVVHLCILCFSINLLIWTPTVSSQRYSFMHKDYVLIKTHRTFDDAVTFCKLSGQRLVEISSQVEQDFIFRMVVSPTGHWIWLGATNIVGTKNFTWLADGSDVTSQYSNWRHGRPNGDVNLRRAMIMYSEDGKWGDLLVSDNYYSICERDKEYALQSSLLEQSTQCNAMIKQLDSQLELTSSTQRKEYLHLIQINADNQVKQKELIGKLANQANDVAVEVEFQKKHFESRLSRNENACSDRMARLKNENDLLERRLSRLEHKMSNNIVDNSNKIQ